jgi:DNA helicase-2/ATP-dependent DNA helicase PcrA
MQILNGLNPMQVSAVEAVSGPVLIIAGAGSGKTRALTHRIAYLIQEKGVSPYNILAVTFTNKAAEEMKRRIAALLGLQAVHAGNYSTKADMPTVGTFHAFCAQILRIHIHNLNFENNFVIYDTADQLALMKELMRDHAIDEKQFNPKAILGHISAAKNELVTPEEFASRVNDFFGTRVAELYGPYQRRLAKNQALDFDDLLVKTVELFEAFPALLDSYQERYRYISVDEYQDTNTVQYRLTHMLAKKYRNLCVIGDPDQSIYSWRGANMQNILDFEKDYPDALVIKLEQNYRSTSTILDASHAVIQKNARRKEKRLWTERTGGELIRVLACGDERDEAERVALSIQNHLRTSEVPSYKNFAALYRTNAQSRTLEEALMRFGIPYRIVGGLKFYLRKEIKDIISYLRVIHNPADTVSLLRIINTPPRKIGPKKVDELSAVAAENNGDFFAALAALDSPPLRTFTQMIAALRAASDIIPVSALIKQVIVDSGYKNFLLASKSPEDEARLENIEELITVADKYNLMEPRTSLASFLEEISLLTDIDQIEEGENAVTLMTLHSAKGLEFPVVFITGLEEGIFPHSRSLFEPQELEEERRLMYVGMTRAMDNLYLLHARRRMLYGEFKCNAPSQFLADIPSALIEGAPVLPPHSVLPPHDFEFADDSPNFSQEEIYKPIPVEPVATSSEPFIVERLDNLSSGDRLRHRTFGEGIVTAVNGGIVTVAFKDQKVGTKKLALSVAPLQRI